MAESSGMRTGLKGNVEEALRLFSREAEWGGLNLNEAEFVLEETLKCYGSTFDGEMIRSLFAFYRRYLGMADVARRQRLLSRMTEFISNGHQPRYVALLCFISADKDGQITSGAALDLAMVMPCDDGDPLAGPKYVAQHGCGGLRAKFGGPKSDDEGDVAAGLLLLGDMRLLPLLEEIWERLTPEGRRRMVQRRSNLVSALMVEFLLRRLEADKDEEYFGELGAALYSLPAIAAQQPINAVLDLRRNFGLPPGKEPMELIGHEDIPTAFARFRPRLQALIDRESGPIKVLNATISVWAEAAGWSPPAGTENVEVTEEEAELNKEDKYTDISSKELHDEFEAFSAGNGFAAATEDIAFWGNPYKTRSLDREQLRQEFGRGPLFPLLVTGVFNPFGPTLNIYLVQPDAIFPSEWRLSLYTLNPFSCTKADLGMLDERVKIEPGQLDRNASASSGTIVMQGRNIAALRGTVDFVARFMLGKSRILPSFTLCHVMPVQGREETLKLVATLYQAMAKGRDDLDDFRDKRKRRDPWARADMSELLQKVIDGRIRKTPERLSETESMELAQMVMNPAQQRIEMVNLLEAWDGASRFNPELRPMLGSDTLLQLLAPLGADLPGLLKLSRDEHGTQAFGTDEGPEATQPDLTGLPEKILVFGYLEVLVAPVALVVALCYSAWTVAGAIGVFLFVHLTKLVMIRRRQSLARWVGLCNYLALWWTVMVASKYLQPNYPHESAMELKMLIGYWCLGMGVMHLCAFDFAQQMREAPDEKG